MTHFFKAWYKFELSLVIHHHLSLEIQLLIIFMEYFHLKKSQKVFSSRKKKNEFFNCHLSFKGQQCLEY